MSVQNGNDADQTEFNTSFMSREVDTSTAGKVDLVEASSSDIIDLQGTLNTKFTDISQNTTDIGTNATDIATNVAAIALNTAKVTNATHTGEVTGSTTLTLDPTAISNKGSVAAAAGDTLLIGDADDSNNLKQVTAQSVADLGGGGGAVVNPNTVSNGAQDFWRRGTSFTAVSNGDFTADRVNVLKSNSAVIDVSRSTDVPSESYKYSHLHQVTTADASVAVGDFYLYQLAVQGFDYRLLHEVEATFTFKIKSVSKTGDMFLNFRNRAANRSYNHKVNIPTPNVWQTVTHTLTTDTGGVWELADLLGIRMGLVFMAGSNFTTTVGNEDTWIAGNIIGSTDIDNFLDNTANDVHFTGLKFEPGDTSTPFIHSGGNYAGELLDTSRFFQKSYELDTVEGTATRLGAFRAALITATQPAMREVVFKNPMNSIPAVVIFSPDGGTIGSGSEYTAAGSFVADRAVAVSEVSREGFRFTVTGGTISNDIEIHYTAKAETL